MDPARLSSDITAFDAACAYWSEWLVKAPPHILGEVVRTNVPPAAGVYIVRLDGDILYIGKSVNLRNRICSQHLAPRKRSSTLRRKVSKHIVTDDEELISVWLRAATIGWIELGHHGLTLAVEDHAIAKYNPPFNGYT